jgi:hypothetical protein
MQEVELKRHQAALYKEQVSHCLSLKPLVIGCCVLSRPQVSNPSLGTAGPGLHVQGPFPGPPAPGRWRPACLLPRPQARNPGHHARNLQVAKLFQSQCKTLQEEDAQTGISKVNTCCAVKLLECTDYQPGSDSRLSVTLPVTDSTNITNISDIST